MRPTMNLTHIIFKAGRPLTVHRYHAHPDPKPVLVGIGWAVKCKETGARVEEQDYIVEVGRDAVMQKKQRRSMEPRSYHSVGNLAALAKGDIAKTSRLFCIPKVFGIFRLTIFVFKQSVGGCQPSKSTKSQLAIYTKGLVASQTSKIGGSGQQEKIMLNLSLVA